MIQRERRSIWNEYRAALGEWEGFGLDDRHSGRARGEPRPVYIDFVRDFHGKPPTPASELPEWATEAMIKLALELCHERRHAPEAADHRAALNQSWITNGRQLTSDGNPRVRYLVAAAVIRALSFIPTAAEPAPAKKER